MKILKLFSDAQKTCAEIIYNEQTYEVSYKNGRALQYEPVPGAGSHEIQSAPPTLDSEAMDNLLNLLEAMDYAVHGDMETAIISPMLRIDRSPSLETDWTLEKNWKSSGC